MEAAVNITQSIFTTTANLSDFYNETIDYRHYNECRQVHFEEVSDRCEFIKEVDDCQSIIGYVNYNKFMFCSFESPAPAVVLGVLWLFTLFIGLGVTANNFLCPALFVISKTLRMSQNVAGVTLLAFGNGAPDIFSAMAGVKQHKNELVIGGLIGGGIFVTTIVAGSIFIFSKNFTLMKRPFLRDVLFYVGAATWAFYLFYTGGIYIYHSIGFILLYVVYIIVVITSRIIRQKQMEKTDTGRPLPLPTEVKEKGDGKETKVPAMPAIKFQCSKSDMDDPESYGVVLKAFFYLNEEFLGTPAHHSTPRHSVVSRYGTPMNSFHVSRQSVTSTRKTSTTSHSRPRRSSTRRPSGFINQAFTVPVGDNICITADNMVINIDPATKNPCGKMTEMVIEEDDGLPPLTEMQEFLRMLSPINFENWDEMVLWEKILEIVKAPVLFILTLTTPVVDLSDPKQYWCRILNTIHCFTGPFFIGMVAFGTSATLGGKIPALLVFVLIGLILAALVFFTSKHEEAPRYHVAFSYLGFLVSVFWIYCIANEIVVLLQAIGIVFNLSDSIIGLTILAWGNCLLDFLSNVAVARKGFPRMGIAACFGSPFLTLLLGVGIPTLIMLASSSEPYIELHYSYLSTVLFTTLAVSLVSTVVTMASFRFRVRKPYGAYLILLYFVFLVTAVVIESGLIS